MVCTRCFSPLTLFPFLDTYLTSHFENCKNIFFHCKHKELERILQVHIFKKRSSNFTLFSHLINTYWAPTIQRRLGGDAVSELLEMLGQDFLHELMTSSQSSAHCSILPCLMCEAPMKGCDCSEAKIHLYWYLLHYDGTWHTLGAQGIGAWMTELASECKKRGQCCVGGSKM